MANAGLNQAARDRIDDVVGRYASPDRVPGVVAAVARGDDVHVAVAGTMAVGGGPMRPDTLFRISSMTKPMTAACVLALVDEGVFELDAPVTGLLPELAARRVLTQPDGPLAATVPAERPVTVEDLLTFTWGLGMQGAMFAADEPWPIVAAAEAIHAFGPPAPAAMPDPDTWIAQLGELPLLAQPGERWLYSTGSQVLGVLAARAAGAGFDQVLQERVLGPLGMADTAFFTRDTGRLATAYALGEGSLVVWDPPAGQWSAPPAFPDGAAGLVSTAEDVLAFGRMLLRGGVPVLRPATAARMVRNHLSPTQRARVWPGFDLLDGRGWGYGLSVVEEGPHPRYGWDGGLGTTWYNVPDRDAIVVVLTQRLADEGMPAMCDEVLQAVC